MGGASSYYAIIFIIIFLLLLFSASKVSKAIGISSIVLEIGVGLVLSPQVLNFLPEEYSTCYTEMHTDCDSRKDHERIARLDRQYCDLEAYLAGDKYGSFWGDNFTVTLGSRTYTHPPKGSQRRLAGDKTGKTDYDSYEECLKQGCTLDLATTCATTPNILTLIGHAGVAMMIFESGMHFDFEQAKKVGGWACAVALLGTCLPLISGCALIMAFGFDFSNGFAAGVALAPTSVGIALRLLHEAKALQTFFGQAIITAAFVDDILSLLLYNILFSLQGDVTFMNFLPMILGLIFMAVTAAMGACFWPKALTKMFQKIPDKKADAKLTQHHEILFILMVVILIFYAQITHMAGTHLWGCFIAGMSFAMWKEAHHVWVRQTKRITVWMIRIFFSATVGFAIPITELLSIDAFWRGALLGIGPCILTKVLCAPFMGDARFVIGWAMVGRAEFAYLIAQMAAASAIMSGRVFSIVIWALLWATVFAPFIFRVVLNRYMKRTALQNGADVGEDVVRPRGHMRVSGHLPDLVQEEMDAQKPEIVGVHKMWEIDNVALRMRLEELQKSEAEIKDKIKAIETTKSLNI